jgi:hypothetical protein
VGALDVIRSGAFKFKALAAEKANGARTIPAPLALGVQGLSCRLRTAGGRCERIEERLKGRPTVRQDLPDSLMSLKEYSTPLSPSGVDGTVLMSVSKASPVNSPAYPIAYLKLARFEVLLASIGGPPPTARFFSKERLMGLSLQVQFSAAKMGKVLLNVEAHMHRSKMNIAPGTLDRMSGGEGSGATHGDQGVNGTYAKFCRTGTITHRPRTQGKRGRR